MSKAADMAKVSARGGFHLWWGLVLSTVISSVGTIIVANLLGSDGMGLYYVALAGPSLIQTFRDWGIGAAVIKYSAEYNSQSEFVKVKGVILAGLGFQLILGLLLNVFTFFIAGLLATYAYQRPGIESLIQISSFILLAGALTSSASAVFVGLERMANNSVVMVVGSIIKTVLMTIFVVFGFGVLGAVLGNIVSLLISGLTALLLLWLIYKNFPKSIDGRFNFFVTVKMLLKYGVPLSVGNIVNGFLLQYYTIVLAIFVSDAFIGNYSVANTFVVLITFFVIPVSTMLLPAFSKINANEDKETLQSVFGFSVKYGSLLVVPVAMLVMVLSRPAVFLLFGDKYPFTPLYLSMLAVFHLYSAFGNLSLGNLLNSQGETRLTMKLILLTAGIGFPLSYFLVSQFLVRGLILATLIAPIPALMIRLVWVSKKYGLTLDWIFSAKILSSSALSAIVTYFLISSFDFANWLQLLIGVFVFLPLFLIAVILSRTIDRSDIDNLRNMTESLGPLHSVFCYFLRFIEWLMKLLGM